MFSLECCRRLLVMEGRSQWRSHWKAVVQLVFLLLNVSQFGTSASFVCASVSDLGVSGREKRSGWVCWCACVWACWSTVAVAAFQELLFRHSLASCSSLFIIGHDLTVVFDCCGLLPLSLSPWPAVWSSASARQQPRHCQSTDY